MIAQGGLKQSNSWRPDLIRIEQRGADHAGHFEWDHMETHRDMETAPFCQLGLFMRCCYSQPKTPDPPAHHQITIFFSLQLFTFYIQILSSILV